MKFLFIWPNKDQFGFRPMSLAMLSAILKKAGHEVELFDTTYIDFGFKGTIEVFSKAKAFKDTDMSQYNLAKEQVNFKDELLKVLNEFKPDIVGISALSDEVEIGVQASEITKEWNKDAIVIWGNKFATMSPEKVLIHSCVDYVCRGEAIEFLSEFVNYIQNHQDPRNLLNISYRDKNNGEIINNPLRPYFQDLDSLPYFDWTIFDERHSFKPYEGKVQRRGDHMISWGCPNHCSYCLNRTYRDLYGSHAGKFIRFYSVDRIIDELEYLTKKYGITFYKFHDEEFLVKPIEYLRELAEKYSKRINVPFTATINTHFVTLEKVELLKKMGCISVTVGVETGNDKLRKEVLYRVDTKEEIIKGVKMLNETGIRTSAFNMLGLPFESRETVMETIALNREAGVQYPIAQFFFPLEGTPLRKIAIENGFMDEDSKLIFENDKPSLRLPKITSKELIKLHERFVLYIKMPKELYKYIERSEKDDDIAKELTTELQYLYDQYVFSNEGKWNNKVEIREIVNNLEKIVEKS